MSIFSAPTHNRTWRFQVNQTAAAGGAVSQSNAYLWLAIKNAMLGTGSWTDATGAGAAAVTNWTVEGSCNGSAAGMDAVDRWSTIGDIVFGATSGSTRSWIVLYNSALGIRVCFDLWVTFGYTYFAQAIYSRREFTGGATNARPTAISESYSGNVAGFSDSVVTTNYHTMKTSDGLSTRILLSRNGHAVGLWAIEPVEEASSANPYPMIFLTAGVQTSVPVTISFWAFTWSNNQWPTLWGDLPGNFRLWRSRGPVNSDWSTTFMTIPTELSAGGAEWPVSPIWAKVSRTYSGWVDGQIPTGVKGSVGHVVDLWAIPNAVAEGTHTPASGARNFLVAGGLLLPWNTTLAVL
jgi:hypothetical protein